MVLIGYERIHRIKMHDLDLGLLALLVILTYTLAFTLLKMKEQELHLGLEQ